MATQELVFALLGGSLIGLAAASLLLFNGRIAGISGIFNGLLSPRAGDVAWRLLFVAGLVLGGFVLLGLFPDAMPASFERSIPVTVLAGLLVGFGARLGSGCTSGHGVCGTSRLSPRSLIATATFMLTGALSVYVVNHVLGGTF